MLCKVLSWWLHVSIRLSKRIECPTPGCVSVGSSTVTNVSPAGDADNRGALRV